MMRAIRDGVRWAAPILVIGAVLGTGCESAPASGPDPDPDPGPTAQPAQSEAKEGVDEEKGPEVFGEPIEAGEPVELADLVAEPARFEGRQVRTSGVARRVCTRKGCWMELATSGSDDAPGARVTFQDYGFFVPTDSAGAPARVQARVRLETVSAEDVAHLESEGARFPDKAEDGTARELHLVATGVEMDLSS